MAAVAKDQILAAFVVENHGAAQRFLSTIEQIDKADDNVTIVDAAIADRSRFRVKVHQTRDRGAAKGGIRGGALGIVVGAIIAGPAGAAVAGAAGGTLAAIHNRLHDVGVNDKFMRHVTKELNRGKSAVFVLYEGTWTHSIGSIEDAIKRENALLIHSTMSEENAKALRELVEPAIDELGGEDAASDYDVSAEEAPEAPTDAEDEGVAAEAPAVEASPAPEPVPDDLTVIRGIDARYAAILAGGGVDSYAKLAATRDEDVNTILVDAHAIVPDNVDTWAMQAAFAQHGDWAGQNAFLRKMEEMSSSSAAPAADAAAAPVVEPAPAGTPDDLTQLVGIGPRTTKALSAAGISTYAALAASNEPQLRSALHASDMVPPANLGSWPMQASYAAKGDWAGLSKYNQKQAKARAAKSDGSPDTVASAAAAEAAPEANVEPQDMTQLAGVGPRMGVILADAGILTYKQMGHATVPELREIVARAGALPPAQLKTWPTQAAYADKGDWAGLSAYNHTAH